MEKLLFIVPKVLIAEFLKRNTKIVVFVLTSNFFGTFTLAKTSDYGCRFGNRIFQNYDTVHVAPTNFQFDSDGNTFPNGYAHLDTKCDNGSTTVCTLYAFDEITIVGYGILADHSIDYCTVDDYVFTLLIFTISIALFKMREYS